MIQYFNSENKIFLTKEFIHDKIIEETIRVITNEKGEEIERKIIPYMPPDKYAYKFEWTGSDVDTGDTLTYDFYFGSSNPPTTKVRSNLSSTKITQTISDVGVYYWKIITKDNSGSNSDSGISKFTVSN